MVTHERELFICLGDFQEVFYVKLYIIGRWNVENNAISL